MRNAIWKVALDVVIHLWVAAHLVEHAVLPVLIVLFVILARVVLNEVKWAGLCWPAFSLIPFAIRESRNA